MKVLKKYWFLEVTLLALAMFIMSLFMMQAIDTNAMGDGTQTAVLQDDDPDTDPYPAPGDEDDEDSEDAEWEDEDYDDEDYDDEAWDDEEWEEDEEDPIFLAAKLIGIDIEVLDEALASGKSLTEIATENGADVQALTDALIQQELAFIDELEQDGEISAEEANEWRDEVNQYTSFYINTAYTDPELLAAQIIGVDVETLYDALDEDKTIAQIAAENGVDVQTVIDALLAAEDAYADEMFAQGLIDEADLNEWKAENAEFVDEIVNLSYSDFEEEFEDCGDSDEFEYDEDEDDLGDDEA